MAETAIHENGISMRLCDICNTYPDFRKDFFSLFSNFPKDKEIEYMYFSGNIETGFGKPDITIRFDDGDFFFIEVKTKFYTEVQGNQELGLIDEETKERKGYIGLIEYLGQKVKYSYAFLVDQWHPGFEEDTKKIGENGEFSVPVVTWNKVAECLNGYQKNHTLKPQNKVAFFVEDLEKNVDGFHDEDNFSSISDTDLDIISTPSDFYGCLNNFEVLRNLEFKREYNFELLKFTIQDVNTELPNFGWYINVEKQLATDSNKHITYPEWVWIGFNPYLLDENNIAEIISDSVSVDAPLLERVNKFLFGISVYGDMLSHKKLIDKNVQFCKDNSYWFYFPLDKEYAKIVKNINNEEALKNIFEKDIMNKVENIFKKYLPNDTRRINIKLWEDE